jgi:hypothetical protein
MGVGAETLPEWIGRTVSHKPENLMGQILSPGERIQVRAGVKTILVF